LTYSWIALFYRMLRAKSKKSTILGPGRQVDQRPGVPVRRIELDRKLVIECPEIE
jgi:hypothetical protein